MWFLESTLLTKEESPTATCKVCVCDYRGDTNRSQVRLEYRLESGWSTVNKQHYKCLLALITIEIEYFSLRVNCLSNS